MLSKHSLLVRPYYSEECSFCLSELSRMLERRLGNEDKTPPMASLNLCQIIFMGLSIRPPHYVRHLCIELPFSLSVNKTLAIPAFSLQHYWARDSHLEITAKLAPQVATVVLRIPRIHAKTWTFYHLQSIISILLTFKMAPTNSHELRTVGSRALTSRPDEDMISINQSDIEVEMPPLPPTDHGKQAYLVLAGCTLIQAPIWGQYDFNQ